MNYPDIGDLIDFSKPFKKIEDVTSNILITRNNYNPNIIYGESKGVIHVFYGSNFVREYEIKEFNNFIRCIIELPSGLIVACSNYCKVKNKF